MTMQVYHFNRDRMSRDDLYGVMTGPRNEEYVNLYKRRMESGCYDLVAEVEGNELENAWIKTQNGFLTSCWSLNPLDGLKSFGTNKVIGLRSTMIGDIIVVDGTMHVVDIFGFKEIGPFEPRPETSIGM